MSLLKKVRSYFSCPWQAHAMLVVTLFAGFPLLVFMLDLSSILRQSGFSSGIVAAVGYANGVMVAIGALVISILSDNYTGRFPVMCAQMIALPAGVACMLYAIWEKEMLGTWHSIMMTLFGCAFFNVSSGIQRSSMPTFVADQFDSGDYPMEARQRMFSWTYLLFNLAGFLIMVAVLPYTSMRSQFFVGAGMSAFAGLVFFACAYWFYKAKCKKNTIFNAIKCLHYGLSGYKKDGGKGGKSAKASDSDSSMSSVVEKADSKKEDKSEMSVVEEKKKAPKKKEKEQKSMKDDTVEDKKTKEKEERSKAGKDEDSEVGKKSQKDKKKKKASKKEDSEKTKKDDVKDKSEKTKKEEPKKGKDEKKEKKKVKVEDMEDDPKKKKKERKKTFLDKAYPKYDYDFIDDVVQAVRVTFVLLVGIPFWLTLRGTQAIMDAQMQGTNFQTGPFSFNYYTAHGYNAVVVILSIFATNLLIYPGMNWCAKKGKIMKFFFKVTPIRKMGGGALVVVVVCTLMLLARLDINKTGLEPLEKSARIIVWGHRDVQNCTLGFGDVMISVNSSDTYNKVDVNNGTFRLTSTCPLDNVNMSAPVTIHEGVNVFAVFPSEDEGGYIMTQRNFKYKRFDQTMIGAITYQLVTCKSDMQFNITLDDNTRLASAKAPFNYTLGLIMKNEMKISYEKAWEETISLAYQHGSHSVFFDDTNTCSGTNGTTTGKSGKLQKFEIISPHKTSVWYAIGSQSLLAIAEITLSVGAMEFAYMETGPAMKTVMQGIWYITALFSSTIGMILGFCTNDPLIMLSVLTGAAGVGVIYFVVMMFVYKPRPVDEEEEKKKQKEREKKENEDSDTSEVSKKDEESGGSNNSQVSEVQ